MPSCWVRLVVDDVGRKEAARSEERVETVVVQREDERLKRMVTQSCKARREEKGVRRRLVGYDQCLDEMRTRNGQETQVRRVYQSAQG